MAVEPANISRRTLLAAAALAGFGAGCGRKLAPRYTGSLYVARRNQRSVAVVDLAEFHLAGKIDLPSPPAQLIRSSKALLYAVCPDSSAVFPVDTELARAGKPIVLPAPPTGISVLADGNTAIAVSGTAGKVFRVSLNERRILSQAQLPGLPAAFDFSMNALAFAIPSQKSVVLLDARDLKAFSTAHPGAEIRTLRFRFDGEAVLAGLWAERQIVTLDTASGKILTRLSLPIAPQHFCFNSDGGQMFVTGAGGDVVTIVSPYQNEIDQTILAGRTPGSMATTAAISGQPSLLLVTNQESGDLTIINIDRRTLAASVHAGQQPSSVLVTPNGEFALVMNRVSGDVAVVRLSTVLNYKNKTKPLFTVVPVGAEPVSAVIVPRDA